MHNKHTDHKKEPMNTTLKILIYTALLILATYLTTITVVEWMIPTGNYPWSYPIAAILTLATTFAIHHTTRNTEKENT